MSRYKDREGQSKPYMFLGDNALGLLDEWEVLLVGDEVSNQFVTTAEESFLVALLESQGVADAKAYLRDRMAEVESGSTKSLFPLKVGDLILKKGSGYSYFLTDKRGKQLSFDEVERIFDSEKMPFMFA